VSYDLEIGTAEPPSLEAIVAWALERGLEAEQGDGWVEVAELIQVEGPVAAELEDFADEITEACAMPRWMTSIMVPYSAGGDAIETACELAEAIAKAGDGAAFDPQTEMILWPTAPDAIKAVRAARGEPARPRGKERKTSLVSLEWLVTAEQWDQAPATLLAVLARHVPEALPTRYGHHEPLQHRYEDAEAFARFVVVADDEDGDDDVDYDAKGDGFWWAGAPSFGGSWTLVREHGIGALGVDFDLQGIGGRLDAVVALFADAARELGAFFAAAQVEPGVTVNAANRVYLTADSEGQETFLTLDGWRGLPPVPTWLSWFGRPYRDLVDPHLIPERFVGPRKGFLRRRATPDIHIERARDGILVRIGDSPKPVGELGDWPLPRELTYRYRSPYSRNRDGSITSNPPEPGDEAATIPPLRPQR
jgi:hypothetical protein